MPCPTCGCRETYRRDGNGDDTKPPPAAFRTTGEFDMSESLEIAAAAVRLYAESHPRPVHVTQGQAAEMLGLSRPTVKKLIVAGVLHLNSCGLIPIGEVDKAISSRRRR